MADKRIFEENGWIDAAIGLAKPSLKKYYSQEYLRECFRNGGTGVISILERKCKRFEEQQTDEKMAERKLRDFLAKVYLCVIGPCLIAWIIFVIYKAIHHDAA